MKISSITILLLLAVAGLSAQSGLFGLSFGDTLNRADSLLASQRFFAKEVENTLVKYYSSTNKMVESIVLVVHPEQETVAGWLVRYNEYNSKKQDDHVLDKLHEMHGEAVHLDKENARVTWTLTPTRTVTAWYSKPNNLTVFYHDSEKEYLFQTTQTPSEPAEE
ncbi:MAG TPA: hypothetical protein PK802_00835 [Candidatus Cloacimonadota bacterium]|jgi:hypothetical protein|nr:hypothetical protein [Candidatus Cloacimonadota bacterium]HOF59142.1 hypothetical protein [Candidatus Cloacimonadota bacterium]HOR58058.1 hypothetical protein [Candidatus Cloacimonadota bacterium]HPB08222.1 hypothetical protein [Candidatus Cloacimonadota bacterium]HPL22883.1 hypothetical protein [Candidatus Cloacimonadota bacterium]